MMNFSDDGKYLSSCGNDCKVFVFNTETLKKVVEFENVHKDGSYSVTFDNNN